MIRNARVYKLTAVLLICSGATIGCAGTAGQIIGGEATLPEDQGSPGYIDRVSSMETISENNSLRGVLMLLDGKDEADSFQQRIQALMERRIVSGTWDFDADRPITKGKLAYMLYQACKMPGGVTLMLTGPSQRYCLKELQFRGMLSSGMPNTRVTGLEFVAAVTRADTYLQTGELPPLITSRGQ